MDYLLITGCTGLVGRYLLRHLLEEDFRLVALVRPDKIEDGRQRIDGIMRRSERQLGRSLPRPVVLEGDLNLPLAGLSADQLRWLSRRCTAVLHCAASMTFREDKQGEPFRTNVEGTRNLLELCRRASIKQLHHVSTAYICGLRDGRVLETEVDVGQQLGNVYEQSKLRAEKMVRDADFLEQLTVYRPASVIGDSKTGYVSSTHGFYLPLQLAYLMADKVPVASMDERFFARLGLRGDEGKNLVPVDWLSRAISYLVSHPEHHGKTYHLASSKPVLVKTVQKVVGDAIQEYSDRPLATSVSEADLRTYESMFEDYMSIYESHWRDDPNFDLSNTQQALPHLPCPELDVACLMRVAKYPIERRFHLKSREQTSIQFDVERHLNGQVLKQVSVATNSGGQQVGLQISGSCGGHWQLTVEDGQVVRTESGLPQEEEDPQIYLSADTFRSLVDCQITIEEAMSAGQLVIEGARPGEISHLIGAMGQIITAA